MLDRFKAYIEQEHLFTAGEKVLLAVSGGRDSVVMADLAHRAGLHFAIAHCNFKLRPGDCDRDQLFVQSLAEGYGVPFFTTSFDTKTFAAERGYSIEEAARMLRYRWFADICADGSFCCVLTAHHRDDSIETFFLNLFRGTGISGLHGIRPIVRSSEFGVRSLSASPNNSDLRTSTSDLTIVRPLLCFSRTDINAYVEEHGLSYVEDSTNSEFDARRNRIRLRLMPLLRELYPSVDATMQANIDRLYDTEILFRTYFNEMRGRLVRPYSTILPTLTLQADEIPIDLLKQEFARNNWPPSTARTVIFELLRHYGFNAAVSATILDRLDAPSGTVFHSSTHIAEIHRGSIIISGKCEVESGKWKVERVAEADCVAPLSAFHFPLSTSIFVDADSIRQPLIVRPWRGGDRFHPFGMKGSRLVSDFLKDKGLPLVERRHVQLMVDADNNPVWLVGLRADERTRVTANTRQVLRISLQNECPSR